MEALQKADEAAKAAAKSLFNGIDISKVTPSMGGAMLAAIMTVAMLSPNPAWAASGGRVGGSSFSRPSQSRSYSAPSRSYSAPVRPAPYSGGNTVIIAPGGGFGWGYGGWGWGGYGYGAPPIFGGVVFSIFALLAFSYVMAQVQSRLGDDQEGYLGEPPLTLVKVQIGLLSIARSLQADLKRLARSANTSSRSGLQLVLQETVLALLRHPDYWGYAGGKSKAMSFDDIENAFNSAIISERTKFTDETLVNVSGRLIEKKSGAKTDIAGVAEYIVVTLVVASDGDLAKELPKRIKSRADLEKTLKILGSISASDLQAVEVLWTPEDPADVLTAGQFLTDYPELTQI